MKAAPQPRAPRPRWRPSVRVWHHPRAVLPMNSDIEISRSVGGVPMMPRITPSQYALAALGGALGTAARFALTAAAPSWKTLNAGTMAVNLLGPFLLGLLLQSLAQGAETRQRRVLRLVVGVGFLGAFTSYAQLALDTVGVFQHGHVLLATTYAGVTVVAGAVAVWLGTRAASRWYAHAHSHANGHAHP